MPSFFRRIHKPFKRFVFRKSKEFTEYAIKVYMQKYIRKYIMKCHKEGLGYQFEKGEMELIVNAICDSIVQASGHNQTDGQTDGGIDESCSEIVNIIYGHLRNGDSLNENVLNCRINCCVHYHLQCRLLPSSYMSSHTFIERSLPNSDGPPDTCIHKRESLLRTVQYSKELYKRLIVNRGLEHGKAKEYWLFRGPRMALTMIFVIVFTNLVNEYIKGDVSLNDRIASLINSGMVVIVGFFMLYYRLPDSIDSAVCRSAHDYYVETKTSTFGKNILTNNS